MEKFGKYWGIFIGVAGVLVAIAGWLYNRGVADSTINGRIFDSTEQKVTIIEHVVKGPTPAQQQKAYILDSINKTNAIKSRAKRDSIMMAELKARKLGDSINRLNSDQIYQTKEELKEIKRLLQSRN